MQCVSVVVVNFNTAALLRECLSRLFASCLDHPMNVYVVDNGSTDDSVCDVRRLFPQVRVIESGWNLGFAGGNNLALQEILAATPAEADRRRHAVLLLNSDCMVETNTLQQTLDFLVRNPETGVVGPKLVLSDGRLDLACRRSFPTPSNSFWKLTGLARRFPNNRRFASYNLTFLDPDEIAEVDSVSGAYMLVRLAAIDDAGILDDSFFMYGEDLDWAYRIKEHGWKVFYYPKARALHVKGASNTRKSNRVLFEFYRAMYLFHQKHYASRTFFLLNWLITAGIVLRGGLALAWNQIRRATRARNRAATP